MSRRTNPKTPTPRDLTIFERAVVRGERQTDLAREFGLTKQRVNKICGRVGRLVFEKTAEDYSQHRRKTLLRLEFLYGESVAAWENSKAGRCSDTETTHGSSGLPTRSTTRQATGGDVRYLAEARQALAAIRELCGLDPTKAEILQVHTTKTQRVEIDFNAMSIEELEPYTMLAKLRRQGVIRVVEEGDSLQHRGGGVDYVDSAPGQALATGSESSFNFPETQTAYRWKSGDAGSQS